MKMGTNLILTLLFPFLASASPSHEVLAGGLTYHLYGGQGQKQFSNKITTDGALISNPLWAYRQAVVDNEGFYVSETVFTGVNSLAEPLLGYAYSSGGTWSSGRVGLLAGAYLQDNSKYLDKGLIPPMIIPHDGWGPVPVIGVEIVKSVYESVFINTLISPVLLNFSLGYQF